MLQALTRRITEATLVGVDIGSSAVKVVELAPGEGHSMVQRWAVQPIDEDGVEGALRQALRQAGIRAARAAVGLASPEVVVKAFQVPQMPPKELASALQLEGEQAILDGHTPNDVAVDWHVLSRSTQSIRGMMAVVPKSIVAGRAELVRAVGLRAVVVDPKNGCECARGRAQATQSRGRPPIGL